MARRSSANELINMLISVAAAAHFVIMYVNEAFMLDKHKPAHVPLSPPVFIYPEVGGVACWRVGERWVGQRGRLKTSVDLRASLVSIN